MSSSDSDVPTFSLTPVAITEVKRFMEAEGVDLDQGGLRISIQPGGPSGYKYGLLIEDGPDGDDHILVRDGGRIFVDTFSASTCEVSPWTT